MVEEGDIEIVRRRDDGERGARSPSINAGNYFGELGPMFGLPALGDGLVKKGAPVVTGYGLRAFP